MAAPASNPHRPPGADPVTDSRAAPEQRPEHRPRPRSERFPGPGARMVLRIIGVLLFVLFFMGVGLQVLVQLPPLYGLLWSLGLGGAFLWWHARRDRPRRRARVRLRRPRGSPRLMVLAGAATLLVVVGISGLVELFISPMEDLDLAPWERIIRYMETPAGWLAMTAFVALVAPVVEEFCFRGHIQHSLERRYAPWVAILITAALFTAGHISPAHSSLLLIPLILGIGMGMATVLFQSIWVGVVMHGVWNGALTFQSAFLGDDPGVAVERGWLLPLWLILLALGLTGWFLVLRDGRYRMLLARRTRSGLRDGRAGAGPEGAV